MRAPQITIKNPSLLLSFWKKEFILFIKEDVRRSIPSSIDGFKPSQRKIFFYASRKQINHQMVSRLSADISDVTSYHHGNRVLDEVIIRMAQNFMGSNNINLLEPDGQFGSRSEVRIVNIAGGAQGFV